MTQLESTFYILGIVSFALNIIILLGVGLGIVLIAKMIVDAKRRVEEKINIVRNVMKHPEDAVASVGASLIRRCVKKLKEKFSK